MFSSFRKIVLITSSFALFTLYGCAGSDVSHYEIPPDWKTEQVRNETIAKYAQVLRGKKVFLDPGHGGADRRSVGRLKLVTEADINLKVALALREYLEKAGVIVYMSRTKDETVDLKERSYMANRSDADVFISIHHNAPGKNEDGWINYTSTYYHAFETDYEFEPCQKDMARYIQRDLAYVMDNPGGLGSFDGTYSDYHIYPKAGFSVLRITQKPAVLIEGGFFTNNYEERRLAKEEYNRIQAWGIFRGLAKYFQAGIPQIVQLNGGAVLSEGHAQLQFALSDKAGINPKSVSVYVDSVETSFSYNEKDNIISLSLNQLKAGEHSIRVICANRNGNHSFPYSRQVVIAPASANRNQ